MTHHLIKICGIHDPEMAAQAVIVGANLIGIIFHSLSPRYVDIEQAILISQVVRESGASPVGVFVDHTAIEMQGICELANINIVQLHAATSRASHHLLPDKYQRIYVQTVSSQGELQKDGGLRYLDVDRDLILVDHIHPGQGNKINVAFHYDLPFRWLLAGGLTVFNVVDAINNFQPNGVDVSSGVELDEGKKDIFLIKQFIKSVRGFHPLRDLLVDKMGRYGEFGGIYVPELLMRPIDELNIAWNSAKKDLIFKKELALVLKNYAGRPTPLTEISSFAAKINGPRIFLKREDLLHTGAHKLNNALGQCLLAKRMGKTRVIAETGAGQHGVATAAACARFGLKCVIYMGVKDMQRQSANVSRMQLMDATVIAVEQGSATLKEAVNEALRDWSASFNSTHYCLGSALGPHPYPTMVAEFQSVIGKESKQQCQQQIAASPNIVIACIGGGSNSIGLFSEFISNKKVRMIGVEAGGHGKQLGEHAARFYTVSPGVLHGCYTFILQDQHGQIAPTSSISAGLNYPAVAPQHAALFKRHRVEYVAVTDDEAIHALKLLARTEGIICALEPAHALAHLIKIAPTLAKEQVVLLNLSGRGDKDLPQLMNKGVI